MATAYHHAVSSVKKWGGTVDDYIFIHKWFDESKRYMANFRHRALRHHTEGIFMCERIFGETITNSDGRVIPTRWIGEQHVQEDLGRIPTPADWFRSIEAEKWMHSAAERLSRAEWLSQLPELELDPKTIESLVELEQRRSRSEENEIDPT